MESSSELERVAASVRDSSVRVRRSAVVCLAWNLPPDERIGAFLQSLLQDETDEKIRMHAEGGIERYEACVTSCS